MKKLVSSILAFAAFSLTTSFAQNVETGHETGKGTVNFTDAASNYRQHPTPLVRQHQYNEGIEKLPSHSPADPSKVFLYKPEAVSSSERSGTAYLSVSAPAADTFLSTTSNNTAIPPDTHGAVDSNYLVTAINTAVTIQKRTGTTVSSVPLDNFWTSVLPHGAGSFDPRIHFDRQTNRWITACLAYGQTANSQLMVGVSSTTDPTGTWHLYYIKVDATGTNWLDFVNVGFNRNWITIAGNLFGVTSGSFVGAKVYVFNKDSLVRGLGASYKAFSQSTSFTICPAITFDTTVSSMYMIENWDNTVGQMQLWKISGALHNPAMTSVGFPASPVASQYSSFAVSGTAGADFAPQVGSTHKIQTNDGRVNNCVERNGKVWCSHEVFLPYSTTANPTRSSIMWWQIDTAGTVNQNGLIDDATGANFYAFPSIAVNSSNDMLIGYSKFSSTTHPYAMYSQHAHTDPTDSIRPGVIFRHGQATYYQTYSGTENRWGDYSSTVVDPVNDQDFYTIQESVPASPANYWDTWWAHIKNCTMPSAVTSGSLTAAACIGNVVTYTVGAASGATSYAWTVAGTGWSGTSTTNSINLTVGTGTATVTVKAVNSCGSASAFSATIKPIHKPVSSFTERHHAIRPTLVDTITFTGTTYGTTTYTWGFGGGTATPGTGVGPQYVHWAAVGLYTVSLSVSDSGCSSSFSDTVRVSATARYGELSIPQYKPIEKTIQVVPNPNNGTFEILFSDNVNGAIDVKVSDMNGRVVFNKNYGTVTGNKVNVQTEGLPSGNYVLTIINGSDVTSKVITLRN